MFIAVPTSVWSARKFIAATARRSENAIPASALASSVSIITARAGEPAGSKCRTNAPPRAPATMTPSSPRFMTPECSENMPPRATRIKTEA